jgi:hypothetical protein
MTDFASFGLPVARGDVGEFGLGNGLAFIDID